MNAAPQVLLVEDDEPIRRFLVTSLAAEGYVVHEAATAAAAQQLGANRRVDIFLVDLGLPGMEGVELIRRLRTWTHRPVIVISARTQEREKVEALDAGADDYLVKPFGAAELHARLRVALRHAAQTALDGRSVLRAGAVEIDLGARRVSREGKPVHLTATEWRLLEALARRAGRLVTSTQLMRDVWGPGRAEHGHYLRIYVRQLRQKLEEEPARPALLITDTGVGYRLVVAGAGEAPGTRAGTTPDGKLPHDSA